MHALACRNRAQGALLAGPESYPRRFFQASETGCTAENEHHIVTTQKTKHKRGFCISELPESFFNTLFFSSEIMIYFSVPQCPT